MWDLIELVIEGIMDTVFDFDVTYHRNTDSFAMGCLMKVGVAVLGLLTILCWVGGIRFMAWFFGIPAVILLAVLLKHEWDCYREG